jgi:F-type H+-transporting ATPase subunit delta
MTKTAELYGGSLYDLAVEENCAAAMMEELDGIRKIFMENPDYVRLLSEPSIPRAERISLIDQAFDGQVHPYVNNFMKVLCREGLIRELTGCIAQFRSRFYKDQNIAEAVVTSAVPLNEKQISALLEKLEKLSGKTILLQQKVDAKVIGGLKVEVDGMQLDGTLENRISTVRRKVTEIIL